MAKKIFITGTGTDVGKTFVTGLMVKKLKENGLNAAYYKAAMSGNERTSRKELVPGDALYVKKLSGITQPLEEMCPYVYERAVSPHLASRTEGNPVVMEVVKAAKEALYTGNIGDGKIFVYDVENVIKVRTGEEGVDALQGDDDLLG